MKRKIFISFAFLMAIISSGTLRAQENARSVQKTLGSNKIKSDEVSVVRVNATKEGCNIVVGNEIVSPRDAASGLPTGKRMHKPFVITKELGVTSANNEVHELATAKNTSSGISATNRTAGQPIGGIIVKGGRNPGGNQFDKIIVEDGQFTLPSDCPDGEYSMTLSWSWGASHSGSQKNFQKSFKLTMENGVCKGITQSGIK